jgi:hypothetical protein
MYLLYQLVVKPLHSREKLLQLLFLGLTLFLHLG